MRDSSYSKSTNRSGDRSGFGGFLRRPFARNNMSKNSVTQKQNFAGTVPQGGNNFPATANSSHAAAVHRPSQSNAANNNHKRRGTFGSRLSVHSLFFPSAYSTPVGGGGNSASANGTSSNASTNAALISANKEYSVENANRSTKMSRSTNDLQNSVAVMTSVSNADDPDRNSATPTVSINRSGSTERLLTNGRPETEASGGNTMVDRGVAFLDSKSMSLAPSDDSPASRSGSASDHDQDSVANFSASTGASNSGGGTTTKVKQRECPLCLVRQPSVNFPQLSYCHHRSCQSCLVQYLHMEILESRVNVTCPECNEPMHPNDIYKILSMEEASSPLVAHRNHLIEKYEEFSVRRVLMSDPDTRWCPAPDCSYAVIASGCAACPELKCQRPGCGSLFCYHCKMTWHPNQTCDEARAQRGSFAISPIHIDTTIRPGDIKACPRCRTYIVKMNDGSCNHMICALCGAEFCWLCLREISDLHYLSPSGCTFWGKKPWSRKKKLLWQLGMLVGAPVGIALVAGLAVPAIIFGVPVWVGRKVHQKLKDSSKTRRRLAIAGSVFGSVLMSPVLASMAVGVGVPIMLAYVYGVVPLSLCRNGSCGVTASTSGVRLDLDDDIMAMTGGVGESAAAHEKAQLLKDVDKQDASTVTGFSMQSGSTQHKLQIQADVCSTGTGAMMGGGMPTTKQRRSSMESGATASLCGERCYINYEEASTKALAGSTYCDDKSVHTMGSLLEGGGGSYYVEPDQTSMKGLNGSVGGPAAETKSSKSVSSGGAALGQTVTNVNVDNASMMAMAGSICGVPADTLNIVDGGQCSRCGGRRSSTSLLRTNAQGHHHSTTHHHHQSQHHYHVHIDDQACVDERDRERENSVVRHHSLEPRVTRFADDPYSFESSEVNLLDRHCGILPIDEESNTSSTASKLLNDDQPTTSSKLSPANLNYRQSMEKSSSLRRFLFLRSGTTSDEPSKRKRSPTSMETESHSGPSAIIDLKPVATTIGGSNKAHSNDEKRCRLHRDECQCDDAEFLLLPPDAYIIQSSNRFGSRRLSNASSRNGPMKKSRSWSALLLDGGSTGATTTSSVAAELWSTVRGAFGGGSGTDADVEAAYRPAARNVKRPSAGGGFVQRLKPGRRATVSTSVANVSTSSKRPLSDKKSPKSDVASSCTSLPDTYSSVPLPATSLCVRNETSMDGAGELFITLPNRQRTPSDSSRSKAGTTGSGARRISTTLANFFKPAGEK